MMFRKRNRGESVPPEVRNRAEAGKPEVPDLVHISFDMMLKGFVTTRRGETIRQFCVSLDGTARLVTSGDTVDRKTYEALVAAGAVAPVQCAPQEERTQKDEDPVPDDEDDPDEAGEQ